MRFILFLLAFHVLSSEPTKAQNIQKLTIEKTDSSIWLTAHMRFDYRIFGYEKPDVHSKKLILISIFTDDVEDNPYQCPFGAYYETSDIKSSELKFSKATGNFIEALLIKDNKVEGKIFFEKKWVQWVQ